MSRRYAVLALALALLLTGCASQPLSQGQPSTTTPTVTATPSAALAATPTATAAPAAPILEITVTGTMPSTDTWEPPTYDAVYRVIDPSRGYPEDGTMYLVAHARTPWRGHAPGNDWVDRLTEPGQTVTIDGVRYVIDAIDTVDKPSLADAPIWGPNDPNRAVLITCVPLMTGETATQNRVITLTKEAP